MKTKIIMAMILSIMVVFIIIFIERNNMTTVKQIRVDIPTRQLETVNIEESNASMTTVSISTSTTTTKTELSTTKMTTTSKTTTSTTSTTVTTSTLTTTTVEERYYLFNEDSMRVHTKDCIYADESMTKITSDYIDIARACTTCNPDIEIGTIYEEEENISSSSDSLSKTYVNEMTYYSGPYGCYGSSGRTLINNYSVGCNSIPLGTIIYIKSSDGSIDGYYRVDDTGGMSSNVVDIFYTDYSYVPSSFKLLGRVSVEVYIVN